MTRDFGRCFYRLKEFYEKKVQYIFKYFLNNNTHLKYKKV